MSLLSMMAYFDHYLTFWEASFLQNQKIFRVGSSHKVHDVQLFREWSIQDQIHNLGISSTMLLTT